MSKKLYFKSIDGLRFIAAVNIVLFHFEKMGGLYELKGKPELLFNIIRAPMFHASIFFMLGGFIFTIKYHDIAFNFALKTFLKKRFTDLYPLHFFTTIAMIPLLIKNAENNIDVPAFIFSLLANLTLLNAILPLSRYTFNTPSWALSAFFLAYVIFPYLIRFIYKIEKKRQVFLYIFLAFIPLFLWNAFYVVFNAKENNSYFFHVFAFSRIFEFIVGMLIAKLFIIRNKLDEKDRLSPVVNDLIILLCISALLFFIPDKKSTFFYKWMTYHFVRPVFFAVILYRLARGRGVIASFFAIPFVRNMGKSSFYPYLLHIPLISWICFILEEKFNYYKFLHKPEFIVLFIIGLYMSSMFYVEKIRRRKSVIPVKN